MKQTILDNGLKIITEEDSNSKVCTMGYVVKSGSYHENDNEKGIAHLTEHMLFKGTTNRHYKDINREIESIGGYFNAETNFDYTKYYCTVPSDNWNTGIDVITDIMFNHIIPDDELQKEKLVVQEELKMYNDDPQSFVCFKLIEKMFEKYPNRQLVGGTINTVANISRDDIIDFINRNYFPENMLFVATGNVDHDQIVNFIKDFFNKSNIIFENYQIKIDEFKQYNLDNKIIKYKKPYIEQKHIAFGMFGPAYNDDDTIALQLVATILGGNCSSILYNVIREQKGLAYSIGIDSLESLNDVSILSGYAGLNSDCDIIEEITEQILNIKNNINEEILESTKAYIIGMMYLQLEKTSGKHTFISDQILHNNFDSIDDIISKIKKVDINKLIKVIDKYLTKDNLIFIELSNK